MSEEIVLENNGDVFGNESFEKDMTTNNRKNESYNPNKDTSAFDIDDGSHLDEFEYSMLKRKRIQKIIKYHKTFPKKLGKPPKITELDKYDLQKLDLVLKECKYTIGCANANKTMTKMANGAIMALEKASPYIGLNLNGLSAELMADEDFQDNLKELMLEYDEVVYTKPEYRLIQTLMMKGAMIHTKNNMLQQKPTIKPSKTVKNIIDDPKFNDL